MTVPFEVTVDGLVGNPAAASAIPLVNWAIATGTSDAIVAAYTPANLALVDGLILGVRALAANSTTTPTFAPDGLPPHIITKNGGSPLELYNIPSQSAEILLRYNLANTRWELLNPAARRIPFKALTANDTGGLNVNTAQPWFPTAGALTVAPGVFHFRGRLSLIRTAGTTSHTTSIKFGGTATLSDLEFTVICNTTDLTGVAAASISSYQYNPSGTGTVVKAASTSATEQIEALVEGYLVVTVGGSIIPQFQYSAAPGGAPTVSDSTFFRMDLMTNPLGNWA